MLQHTAMGQMILQRGVLLSGPWRPAGNRPLSFLASLFVTCCLFGWLTLLNTEASDTEDLSFDLSVVEVDISPPPPEPQIAKADDKPAGIEAIVQAPAAPSSPAPVAPSRPINPPSPREFNPTTPLSDVPVLDIAPVDLGRGIRNAPGANRDGGANGVEGNGGGTAGDAGGSGSGGGSSDGIRTDLTARWAPSMEGKPFPAVYPASARAEQIIGVVHLLC